MEGDVIDLTSYCTIALKSFGASAATPTPISHSGGLRPPDPVRFWGIRPQAPVKCERDQGRGLTTKAAYGSRDSGRPK